MTITPKQKRLILATVEDAIELRESAMDAMCGSNHKPWPNFVGSYARHEKMIGRYEALRGQLTKAK